MAFRAASATSPKCVGLRLTSAGRGTADHTEEIAENTNGAQDPGGRTRAGIRRLTHGGPRGRTMPTHSRIGDARRLAPAPGQFRKRRSSVSRPRGLSPWTVWPAFSTRTHEPRG